LLYINTFNVVNKDWHWQHQSPLKQVHDLFITLNLILLYFYCNPLLHFASIFFNQFSHFPLPSHYFHLLFFFSSLFSSIRSISRVTNGEIFRRAFHFTSICLSLCKSTNFEIRLLLWRVFVYCFQPFYSCYIQKILCVINSASVFFCFFFDFFLKIT
jgi:hypothetical protein